MSAVEEVTGHPGSKHREMVYVIGGVVVVLLGYVVVHRRSGAGSASAAPTTLDSGSGAATTQDPYGGTGGGVLGQTDSNASQFGQFQGVIDGLNTLVGQGTSSATAAEAAATQEHTDNTAITTALGTIVTNTTPSKGNTGGAGKPPVPKPKPKPGSPKPKPKPAAPPKPPSKAPRPSAAPNTTNSYTVVKGDTLSGIAKKKGTTVGQITKVSHIQNPNLIHPGQVIHY